MAGLERLPYVRTVPGVVVDVGDGVLAVNVGGSRPPVVWPAGYIPTPGDAVRVRIIDGVAEVTGVQTGPRPLTGTVAGSPASGRVPVSTVAGEMHCRYVGDAPGIGALVRLDWQATSPWIWPSAAATVPAPTTPDDPGPSAPPTTSSGILPVPAIDSGTWSSLGAWDSYYRSDLTQGSWGGRSYTGAWFYGSVPRQLRGRAITRFRIKIPARQRMGSYNTPLTLRLYRHTANTRPGGDVARADGPVTVTLPATSSSSNRARWEVLPTTWGQDIVNDGGGIGIAGGDYGGIAGITDDPTSGQLRFDWTR